MATDGHWWQKPKWLLMDMMFSLLAHWLEFYSAYSNPQLVNNCTPQHHFLENGESFSPPCPGVNVEQCSCSKQWIGCARAKIMELEELSSEHRCFSIVAKKGLDNVQERGTQPEHVRKQARVKIRLDENVCNNLKKINMARSMQNKNATFMLNTCFVW